MRKGIFGGTFNPVHYGHLRAAEEVRIRARLDLILFVPAGIPPLKDEDLIAAAHRYEMTCRAVATNRHFEVSDIELGDTGKSFTYRTLERLRRQSPEDELLFILGFDSFLDMPLWRNPEHIIDIFDLVVVARLGYPLSRLADSPYLEAESRGATKISNAPFITPLSSNGGPEVPVLKLTSGRKAYVVATTPLGICSTEIRRCVKAGQSIKYLVPEPVEAYIHDNRLYDGQACMRTP